MDESERETPNSTGDGPERFFFDLQGGQRLSALRWGEGEPKIVFLHGRGQNAYTWATVIGHLGLPALAVDLPGHGHSDWRPDHDYGAWPNADAIASVIKQAARNADAVVGMSLGGTTTIRFAARYPQLAARAVVVDASPASRDIGGGVQRGATALLEGPSVFSSFDEMLQSAVAAEPDRPLESLRRGVLHNSRELDDATWMWRYDPQRPEQGTTPQDRELLWDDLGAIKAPIMLVRAGRSARVHDEDVERFLRYQPDTRVELVADSGHTVQSDQPELLAGLLADFLQ